MMITWLNFAGRVRRHKEARRFVKFFVVGAIGAVVDFGSANLLLVPMTTLFPEQAGVAVATSISFVLAIISNFIWNRYWTYPDSRSKRIRRQFVQFFLVNVSALLVRLPIVTYAYPPFRALALELLPDLAVHADRIAANVALALAVGIAMFWNFFVNRYWTYGDVS